MLYKEDGSLREASGKVPNCLQESMGWSFKVEKKNLIICDR